MSGESATMGGGPPSPPPAWSEAAALPLSQVEREIADLHRNKHRTLRCAIHARAAEALPDGARVSATVRGAPVRFRVVAVESELDLRQKLAREDEEATAYLVPFARHLPRDIEGVLAGGRLFLPEVEQLLPRRFGARSATPRLRGSRLRLVAQSDGARAYLQGEAASVDLDDAWLAVLRDRLSSRAIETEAQLFTAALLDRDRRGAELGARIDAVAGARQELFEVLDRRLGSCAELLVSAWFGDRCAALLAAAIAGEATRAALAEAKGASFTLLTSVLETRVKHAAGHPLRGVVEKGGSIALAKAMVDLGHLVPLVWPKLAGDEALRRSALDEAEALLAVDHVKALAIGSNRLPFAFERRCEAFVESIEAVVREPSAEAVARVDRRGRELCMHEAAARVDRLGEQVVMAQRLSAFLIEPIAMSAMTDPLHVDLVRLATFQNEVGGYVDWARQIVRAEASGPLGRRLAPLTARVDEIRDALDARFARAYASVLGEKGDRGALRGSVTVDGARGEVVPIEDALGRMGLALLEERSDLRLLVLCMDGMSTANWAELRGSIAKTSFVAVSRGKRAAVIAHVPTITSLSRSALFAGRAMTSADSLDTGDDGKRLTQHATVRRLGETPRVLLRGELTGVGGALSADAEKAVREGPRLVAVVVNAIDDQLKGSAQLRVTLSKEHILPLGALLEAAESAGRLVLVVSDHGNVSSQRFVGAAARTATEGGARHRHLAPTEAAFADEIALPPAAFPGAKGPVRVAAAVHEALRYTSMLHAGEHGGASLAEVIAPAMLLAPRALVSDLAGVGLNEIAADPPALWDRDRAPVAAAAPTPAVHTEAPPKKTVPPPKVGQVALPFAATAPPKSGLLAEVLDAKLFKQQLEAIAPAHREAVKKAIELLLHHGGRMHKDALAVGLGIDTAGKGVRVRGFLDRVERVLNVDDEEVVGMDASGQIVTLNEGLLRSIFVEDADG